MARRVKGGNWERETCRLLSLWWTKGKSDDIFWRTKGSGGRATRRGSSGRRTSYQYGDVYATDPMGTPLLDLLTLELKRGYSKFTLQDMIDRTKTQGRWQYYWDQWFQQTITSAQMAGSFGWLMIVKRDFKEALVFMPWNVVSLLKDAGCFRCKPVPFCTFLWEVRFFKGKKESHRQVIKCSCMKRDSFLECVTPDLVKQLARFN